MNQSTYEQCKLALVEEITATFDGVSSEGGISYTEARMLDDCGHYATSEDRAEARQQDTETRWQDVPEDDIGLGAGHSNLSFLDAIGFRYYIPAYIVWYLRYIDGDDPEFPYSGSNTFDSVLFSLMDTRHRRSIFRLFTPEQEKAIAHFLEFDAQRQDSEDARWEPIGRKNMVAKGYSQEEIDDTFEKRKSANLARTALASYWSQFL